MEENIKWHLIYSTNKNRNFFPFWLFRAFYTEKTKNSIQEVKAEY